MNATLGKWIDGGRINIATEKISDGAGHFMNDSRGLFVVHAVLLHTGKVLWFCGHVEHGHYALKSYLFDYNKPNVLRSAPFPLHNPNLARGTTEELLDPTSENPTPKGDFHADLFCCHFVHAPDGKVIVVGGADPDYHAPGGASHESVGEPYMYAFNPDTERWQVLQLGSKISRLAEGRWYPTAVLLGDGRIAIFSGRREHPTGTDANRRDSVSHIVEILTPGASGSYGDYTASTLNDSASPATARTALRLALPTYPGLHLAPDGRIYYTHTTWGLEFPTPPTTRSIEIPPGDAPTRWTNHGIRPAQRRREEGMSVLLPPAQAGKIFLFGGSEARSGPVPDSPQGVPVATIPQPARFFDHIVNSADPKTSEILITSGPGAPEWKPGPTLRHGRINGHAVILPDKKVLIFGGHDSYKWFRTDQTPPTTPSLKSELYDPGTANLNNPTIPMASLNHPRMYHSAAVLLPNGSVLVAGGADPDGSELAEHPGFVYKPDWKGPKMEVDHPHNRKDYEIFRPPYFFTPGAPPKITKVNRATKAQATQATYGSTVTIESPQAASIDAVALIRPGAATHHTDTEQRYVELEPITRVGAGKLSVPMPTNRNLAPPGYYMLWIVAAGKPCELAWFIQLVEPLPVRSPAPSRSP